MANYNVDIEVGVKGTARLDKFRGAVNALAEKVDLINKNFGQGIQNVARYEQNIAKATEALKKARMGTEDETEAVKNYVRALGEANAARARQISLIAREQAASRTINPGATGFSRAQYGPAMPPAMVRQQQAIQGLAGTLNELNEISKQISVSNTNLRTSWGKAFEGLNETAKFFSVSRLNTQTSWLKTFEQLNDTAKVISISRTNTQTSWLKTLDGLKDTANAIRISRGNVRSSWLQALDELEDTAEDIRRANRNRQRRARVDRGRQSQEQMRSAVGSGVIGGAFPLLFGQGLAPALGGGLGGFAGGILGGQFGFGLSLVGTQLGAIFQQAQDVAAALGKAFRTGEQAAQALKDAVGSLGKETENYINNLEQSGQLGRQQEAILDVLEEKFGSQARAYLESAKSADRFKESTDDLFKSLQRLLIPASVEFNAITDGPLIEEPTPNLTKAAERRINLLKGQLDLENLITGEKSLQGTKDFERLATVRKLVAQARFQIDFEKLQNDQLTGRIGEEEYNLRLKIRQTQLGRELTEIENNRTEAIRNSAEEMKRMVDEMVRGVNQAAAPGVSMAQALREENQFLKNAVEFGVEAAEDMRQINRLTFSGAMSASQAMDVVEENRQLKEVLKQRRELNKVSKTRINNGVSLEQSLKKQLARYEEIEPFARKTAIVEADHKVTMERIADVTKESRRETLKTLALKVRQARLDDIEAQKLEQRAKDYADLLEDQSQIREKIFKLQEAELQKNQELVKGLSDTMRDGFVDGIKAATDETRNLGEALANMLNRLSDQLLNIAANLAFYGNAQGTLSQGQGIVGTLLGSVASIFNPFSSLMAPGGRYEGMPVNKLPAAPPPLPPFPGKALGGAVGAGRPYMVGERGPELFVPGAQGNIVPNGAMGSTSVVVNVDASGTAVQGDQGGADQLGRLIGAAVQAELIKQKRPGGLLTR